MTPSPNKKVTCCNCGARREILTMQPDGPFRLFCRPCGRHTTHTRQLLQPKPVIPFDRGTRLQNLANSVRHLTAAMRPKEAAGSRSQAVVTPASSLIPSHAF